MRFVLSVVIICCLVSVSTASESEQEDWKNHKPDSGDKAFLFQTGTNLTVRSLSGMILGMKYHHLTTHAIELRLGFDVGLDESETTSEAYDDSLEVEERTTDDFEIETEISALYIFYRTRPSNILPYVGVGPSVSYRFYSSESDRLSSGNSIRKTKSNDTDIGIGVIGELGFEWFVLPRVSLRASYRAKLKQVLSREVSESWRDDEYYEDEYYKDITERMRFDFGHERTDLGIALYF